MSADQQRDDTPLSEDAEKDRKNPASELFVENVAELKHSKAREKQHASTKARHTLLVLIQQRN